MRFASLALFALVGPLVAAPVPKAVKKKFPDYYPLAAGSVWVYTMGQTEVTLKVKEFDEKGGVKTAKLVTEHQDKEVSSEALRVDQDGVTRTHINDTKIEPELTFLKFGLADEEGWEVKSKVDRSEVAGKFTLKGTEKLKVAAGVFDVVAVEGRVNVAGTDTVIKYWFAEGTGVVKLQYSIGGNDAAPLELKKYTPGKSK